MMELKTYRAQLKEKLEKTLNETRMECDTRTYREWKDLFKHNDIVWQTEGDIRSAFDQLYKDDHRFVVVAPQKKHGAALYTYMG